MSIQVSTWGLPPVLTAQQSPRRHRPSHSAPFLSPRPVGPLTKPTRTEPPAFWSALPPSGSAQLQGSGPCPSIQPPSLWRNQGPARKIFLHEGGNETRPREACLKGGCHSRKESAPLGASAQIPALREGLLPTRRWEDGRDQARVTERTEGDHSTKCLPLTLHRCQIM